MAAVMLVPVPAAASTAMRRPDASFISGVSAMTRRQTRTAKAALLAACIGAVILPQRAARASMTWIGDGATSSWSDAGNWRDDHLGGTVTFGFDGAMRNLTPFVDTLSDLYYFQFDGPY